VGVARQYCGTLGKVANCQVAVTAAPVDGRPRVDGGRGAVFARRVADARGAAARPDFARAAVPREMAPGAHAAAPDPRGRVSSHSGPGDAKFGDKATFRRTLHRLKLPFALGISSTLTVFRGTPAVAIPRRKRPNAPHPWRLQVTEGARPEAVRTIAATLPARAWRRVTWRNGRNRPWAARFAALRVTPAHDWRGRRLAQAI